MHMQGVLPPERKLEPFHMLGVDQDGTFVRRSKPYPRLFAWLLRWLQRRCTHHAMKADVLEGCGGYHSVRWCETCGAIWLVGGGCPQGMPRLCEPTWER